MGDRSGLAVPGRPVADQRPAEQLDVIVGHLAAAVEPLVDDDRFLVRLREEVSLEVFISRSRRVGHVDVRDPALGPLVDLAEVPLDPGAVAERRLVGDRLDDDRARARAVGLGPDLELDPLAGGPFEGSVDLAVGLDLLAVDRQQEIARLDIDPRRRQRGAEARVPVGAAVDRLEPEAAVGDLVVGPEQADGDRLGLVEAFAAAQEAVADRQLAEHHADHAVQVVAGSPGGGGAPRTSAAWRSSRPRACWARRSNRG